MQVTQNFAFAVDGVKLPLGGIAQGGADVNDHVGADLKHVVAFAGTGSGTGAHGGSKVVDDFGDGLVRRRGQLPAEASRAEARVFVEDAAEDVGPGTFGASRINDGAGFAVDDAHVESDPRRVGVEQAARQAAAAAQNSAAQRVGDGVFGDGAGHDVLCAGQSAGLRRRFLVHESLPSQTLLAGNDVKPSAFNHLEEPGIHQLGGHHFHDGVDGDAVF